MSQVPSINAFLVAALGYLLTKSRSNIVGGRCMIVQEFQSLRMESCLEVKGEKDFLDACSNADTHTNFLNYLSGANCQSTAFVSSH